MAFHFHQVSSRVIIGVVLCAVGFIAIGQDFCQAPVRIIDVLPFDSICLCRDLLICVIAGVTVVDDSMLAMSVFPLASKFLIPFVSIGIIFSVTGSRFSVSTARR